MEADFGRDFLETCDKILKSTDKVCKISFSLSRIHFNFYDLWTRTTIPASFKKSGKNVAYLRPASYCFKHRYE